MGVRQVLPKSIKLYLSGVRSFQVNMGTIKKELVVFYHPTLEQVVQVICRLWGEPKVKKRLSITRPVFLAMLATLDVQTQKDTTFHAIFCLAFAGFLKTREFT